MFFLVFLLSGALALGGVALAPHLRWANGPRAEGVLFTGAVVVVGATALFFLVLTQPDVLNIATFSPQNYQPTPLFPPQLFSGWQLFLLIAAVYTLSAMRGVAGFSASIADIIVIVAALMATRSEPNLLLQPTISARPDSPALQLGILAIPLTVFWIWSVSRLSTSLSRVPQIAGPYLGLVALTFLALHTNNRSLFAPTAATCLAGAGLAMLPVALKRPDFNLGWSAPLAMGFLLGLVSALELWQDSLLSIAALAVLAFGLPLLDVSFFHVRAGLRGKEVEVEHSQERLHEALLRRGVSPVKIGLLYFSIGAWLCLVAILMGRWFIGSNGNWLLTFLRLIVWLALVGIGALVFFSLARVLMRRLPGEELPESIEAFGVKITPVSMLEAMDKIEGFVESKTPHHVVTSDANAILRSREDEEYAQILRNAALTTPDGFGVVWGARLLNLPVYERVTGVDMVTGICERAAQKDWGIYILGSEPGVAAKAAENLALKYPGLRVVGTQHGFYSKEGQTDEDIAVQIAAAKPDVLFVAFGIPKQEKFIARHKETMQVPVSLGVGGSFDVYSGKLQRAPVAVQRAGLEWLYRVWIEPSRWKRMGYVPRFMVVAIKTWLFGDKHTHDPF